MITINLRERERVKKKRKHKPSFQSKRSRSKSKEIIKRGIRGRRGFFFQKKKIAFFLFCVKKLELSKMMQIEQQQQQPQQQQNQLMVQNSGSLSFSSHLSKEDEEVSKSALSNFRAKEEEIERKKMEVREKVQLQLGRVEEETKRLAVIREVCFKTQV